MVPAGVAAVPHRPAAARSARSGRPRGPPGRQFGGGARANESRCQAQPVITSDWRLLQLPSIYRLRWRARLLWSACWPPSPLSPPSPARLPTTSGRSPPRRAGPPPCPAAQPARPRQTQSGSSSGSKTRMQPRSTVWTVEVGRQTVEHDKIVGERSSKYSLSFNCSPRPTACQ